MFDVCLYNLLVLRHVNHYRVTHMMYMGLLEDYRSKGNKKDFKISQYTEQALYVANHSRRKLSVRIENECSRENFHGSSSF